MNNHDENWDLFGRALIEVSSEKAKTIRKEHRKRIVYSKEFKEKMRKELHTYAYSLTLPKYSKYFWAALFAAGIYLLRVAPPPAHADPQTETGFYIETFDDHTEIRCVDADVSVDTSLRSEIPHYIPDGYYLKSYNGDELYVRAEWVKEGFNGVKRGNCLVYEVNGPRPGYAFWYDIETSVETIRDRKVMMVESEYENFYLWRDGDYSFALCYPLDITKEQAVRMVESVLEYSDE